MLRGDKLYHDSNPARRLPAGDMINLKPWQYKVR